jgi:hypothetical protein
MLASLPSECESGAGLDARAPVAPCTGFPLQEAVIGVMQNSKELQIPRFNPLRAGSRIARRRPNPVFTGKMRFPAAGPALAETAGGSL